MPRDLRRSSGWRLASIAHHAGSETILALSASEPRAFIDTIFVKSAVHVSGGTSRPNWAMASCRFSRVIPTARPSLSSNRTVHPSSVGRLLYWRAAASMSAASSISASGTLAAACRAARNSSCGDAFDSASEFSLSGIATPRVRSTDSPSMPWSAPTHSSRVRNALYSTACFWCHATRSWRRTSISSWSAEDVMSASDTKLSPSRSKCVNPSLGVKLLYLRRPASSFENSWRRSGSSSITFFTFICVS
mmetsp:Transcript_49986/g.118237  ORF Transcript_49986/g.118237 Transcript_49986/m.118237 type:complete len:248 (-) Transcript_49986:749-1492(-)